MPRKGKPKHKRRNVSQEQYSPGSAPPSPPPLPLIKQGIYQQREQKQLVTDMNIQAIIPKPGTHQLRSRTIATRNLQWKSPILGPENMDNKTTIDEDLLSRLRFTRSRLEDSEISTDAIDQIDDELEATPASLNKKLQVSIVSATGSGPDSDQYNPSEKLPKPIIAPKPKQKFKALHRHKYSL